MQKEMTDEELKCHAPEAMTEVLLGLNPWEQMHEEPTRAFLAFRTYRDLGAHRSINAAHKVIFGREGHGRLDVWSRQFSWVSRCQAYDRWMDHQYTHRKAEEVKEMAERHAKVSTIFLNKVIAKLQKLDPDTLSNDQLMKWFDVATKIERLSRGESSEIVKHETEKGKGKIDLSKLSDDEFDAIQSIIVRRFDSRKLVGGIGQEKKGEPDSVR